VGHRRPVRRIQSSSCRAMPSVDKMISFLEKAWRRLIEMGRTVLKDVEKKN
jgi:hypothetical protein